jgi:hypothetical protein
MQIDYMTDHQVQDVRERGTPDFEDDADKGALAVLICNK